MESINQRITRLRTAAGMTPAELARAVGVSKAAVGKWESGDTADIKLANILRLCQIFRLTADELIGGPMQLEWRRALQGQFATESDQAAYADKLGYRFPAALEALCSTLDDNGRKFVELQIRVGYDMAKALYGTAKQPVTAAFAPVLPAEAASSVRKRSR